MKLKVDYFSKWLLIVVAVAFCNFAIAQRTITGTVTDAETGEPLIGANILVVGTSSGTITDFDGAYSISVPEGSNNLEVSYTGYAAQTVAIGNQTTVDITLSAGEILDEIVVVGYGSVRKTDATGAVTSVTEKDFNQGVITSPEQLIQGRAAGVQITTSSGEPGAAANIRIRGTSSVRSGNNPLYVVDGVPLSGDASGAENNSAIGRSAARNPLNFINPNDIASIDILKDASATAIYGSRGANGVIIITTKSGQAGVGSLEYSYSLGTATVANRYDLLGRDDFLSAYADFNGQQAAQTLDQGADTDWQEEVFRTGLTHSHNLSYGGGNDKGNFRFSLAYFDQEGVVKESALRRVSARFNGNRKFINDRLTISTQVTVANNVDDNVPITQNSGFRGDLMGAVLKANPTVPARNPDGTVYQGAGVTETEPNPLAYLDYHKGFTNTLRALGNVSASFDITEGLSFKTVLGFDRSFSNRRDAFSRDIVRAGFTGEGRLMLGDVEINNSLWENYFTYTKDFGGVSLTALAGYSYQQFGYDTRGIEMYGFRTSDLDLMLYNYTSLEVENPNGDLQNSMVPLFSGSTVDELQSYFGRVNLGFSDKYLFTFTLRTDGSTRFGSGNKYGVFPSAAFKWRVIDEEWVPDGFTDLGLRLGYGLTGNQEIPHNVFQQRQRYGGWSIDDGGNINGGGLGSVAFENPDLKWESTSQLNIGVDFGFMDNRLSGSIDLYRKNTNDLLFQVTSAQPAPNPFVWRNLDADVINQGVELVLNGVAVDKPNFGWNITANVAFNHNEVQNFGGLINTGAISGQGLTGAFAQRIAEGQPLFAYFLRDFGGYDNEGISVYPNGDFQEFTGESPLPNLNAGLTNSFRMGNFDLNIFFTGQFGHYIYNNTANAYFTAGSLANGRNVIRTVVGNGESNLNAPDVSTRFVEKGDFVRLQNVSLGYNVPLGSASTVKTLRLYVTGQNLAVFTGYSGQDPEVNVNKAIDGVPSFGIDYTTYPRARTIVFGANVAF